MIFITADAYDLAIVFATRLNFNPAIQFTEDTGTSHPFFIGQRSIRHRNSPSVLGASVYFFVALFSRVNADYPINRR